jgi:hypothetical protein
MISKNRSVTKADGGREGGKGHQLKNIWILLFVSACVWECVCVCVIERGRGREGVCVCDREKGRESILVYVRERECVRVCVCVHNLK